MKDMGVNGKGNGSEKLPTEPGHRIPPPSHPPPQCPRCFSTNTRFLSYNNRSALQLRYHCRSCRRGWTLGGTLRNIPIGGNRRKGNKPKGNLASGGLSCCSFSLTGEFSRVPGNLSLQHRPLPPRPAMRSFSYNGYVPIANSFLTFLEGYLSSFANMQNMNHSQGFNQSLPNSGGNISGVNGIRGVLLTNSSQQAVSRTPNLPRPQQIQRPNSQSSNDQQAMVMSSRNSSTLPQVPINRPPASTINASGTRSNNNPGRGFAVNNMNQLSCEFDVNDVDDLFSGPSSPPSPI